MRIAALDLGSNTSLLLIADVEGSRLVKVLRDETTVTRMGQGVSQARRFHPDALKRVEECLERYRRRIHDFKCDHVVAVATSAARDVENCDELLKLGAKNSIPIHIISGAREAQLTFQGAVCDRAQAEGLMVIDVGGGSTEVINQNGGVSVDVGSVRLSELFAHSDPITAEQKSQLVAYANKAFATANLPQQKCSEVVAVAGTPTTLAGLEQGIPFQEDKIHGYKLSLKTVESWAERLARMTLSEREALPGMQPKRGDVIVAGSLILAAAIRAIGQDQVTVSTRGVRYGVALAWQSF